MGMKVFWTDFAKNSLKSIFDYYLENAGLSVARQICRRLVDRTDVLSDFPEMGPIEPLLEDRVLKVRYFGGFQLQDPLLDQPRKRDLTSLTPGNIREKSREALRSIHFNKRC